MCDDQHFFGSTAFHQTDAPWCLPKVADETSLNCDFELSIKQYHEIQYSVA
jgi:hypothetical protein